MSVYRRKGSRFWWIGIQRNGRHVCMSSGTEEREEAEMMERAMKLRLKGGRRERLLAMVDALLPDEGVDVKSLKGSALGELLEVYPELAKAEGVHVSDETLRKRCQACGRLAKWMKENEPGVMLAGDVSVPVAWRFIEACGTHASARTQRKISGELSAVWNTLMRRGLVENNPWSQAKPQRDRTTEATGRAFTLAEVRSLLANTAEPWLRSAVLISLYTGLRQSDVRRLAWSDVDFVRGVVEIVPSKTARHGLKVSVPLHPALRDYLITLPRTDGCICEGMTDSHRFSSDVWRPLLDRAGIHEAAGETLTFHSLRHTFATMVSAAGASEQERMSLGGWSEAKTAAIYNHDDRRLREIVEALPSLTADS